MISLLQKILQKHHKWLFSILLLIVIISFVFTIGSSPGIGRNPRGQTKKIFGYNLSSQKDIAKILQEVELSSQLNQLFIGIPQLKDYAILSRLAALKLEEDLGIPEPDKILLNRFIESYPFFAKENHQFDTNKYNTFFDELQKDNQKLGIFERTVINDFKIATVEKLLLGPGYCLDGQAKSIILQESTKYSFSKVEFDASILSNEVEYTEDELRQYFEEHKNIYKIGEQMILDYVTFSKEFFLQNVPEASKVDLHTYYHSHREQFENLQNQSEEFEKVLKTEYMNDKSSQLAMEAADQFIFDLYGKNIAHDSDAFQKLIEDRGLKVSTLDPIKLGQSSENQYFSNEALSQGSKLNEDRYYSDPVKDNYDNICVLLYNDIIPSIYPPLESIKEQVEKDFLVCKKEENFLDQVQEIQKALSNMQDKTKENFTKIINGKGNITTFSNENLDHLKISQQEKEILYSQKAKSISPVIFIEKMKAEILFLEKRDIPSEIDSTIFKEKIIALEKENKKSFNDYIIEMILDEIDVKTNRSELAQEYQMMFSLIYMQFHRDEFDFYH